MSATLSIEKATLTLDRLEKVLIIIKENLAIFSASEYSKIADFVKKYLEDFFNYLKNKSSKRSIDYILLGFSLEHGIGTIPNLTKAFLEFQKAAKAKDSFGQFFLEKAYKLYSKASEVGNANAQNELALCYQNGLGTMKNEEKAFELFSKAA
ncbi:hypothetical protein G9A89_008488 [Geosiphon pyriformis]|nr:hypothetical protein G9A89_008488 [Geosiphon pyriformis]